jgi:hypothetical protein
MNSKCRGGFTRSMDCLSVLFQRKQWARWYDGDRRVLDWRVRLNLDENLRDGKENEVSDEHDSRKTDQQTEGELRTDFPAAHNDEQEDEERVTARFVTRHPLSSPLRSMSRFRPRRLSELNIVEKVKPIPPYSSLFVFQHTNQ